MLAHLEIRISDAFGLAPKYVIKIRLARLIKVLSGMLVCKYVHKYTKHTHKHKYGTALRQRRTRR